MGVATSHTNLEDQEFASTFAIDETINTSIKNDNIDMLAQTIVASIQRNTPTQQAQKKTPSTTNI